MAENKSLGLFFAICAAFLLSIKPILIKMLYHQGMSPLPLLALRMLLAIPVYLIIGVVLWRRTATKPSAGTMVNAAAVGLLGYYFASLFDMWGLQYVGAQLERMVLYAYPTFVVLLGTLFFRHKLRLKLIIAMLLSYAGITLMYGQDLKHALPGGNSGNISKGTLLILLSALSFALYMLLSKRHIQRLGSLLFTCVSLSSASLATFIHYLLSASDQQITMTGQLWLGTLALVIFVTIIPTFMFSEAIKRIGPQKVGISSTFGPLITTVMAVVFLGEPFSWITATGMALVLIGVGLLQR